MELILILILIPLWKGASNVPSAKFVAVGALERRASFHNFVRMYTDRRWATQWCLMDGLRTHRIPSVKRDEWVVSPTAAKDTSPGALTTDPRTDA